MEEIRFIDSHMHCGVSGMGVKKKFRPIYQIQDSLKIAKIDTACFFANVADIYPRNDMKYVDDEQYRKRRRRANDFLLDLSKRSQEEFGLTVYPYFFVWNDFDIKWEDGSYKGIKWHRHYNEPRYNYKSKECEIFLQKVYKNKLPIVYEEELENTIMFSKRLNGKTILIIPHLGIMNGGYEKIKEAGLWQLPYVYSDLSLASKMLIKDYVQNFGSDRLLYGSDFPFGIPNETKSNVLSCDLGEEHLKKICHENILRILNDV